MTGYGVGIQRGAMAGDHFTQISNALFRDPRISFKAKGIFGLISTHRDGWRVTVVELVRCGPDGRSAVTSALKELEDYGYLTRERARRDDGTLGDALYFITDMPAHLYDLWGEDAPPMPKRQQRPRSQPKSENPAQVNPAQAHRPTKNTRDKKTTQQNNNSVHPSVPDAHARENTDRTREPTPNDDASRSSPGVQLLLSIGARRPELLLTGRALQDQGAVAAGLLRDGWTPEQLEHLVADRPLPEPVRTSVGAIVAARLQAARNTPPPFTAAAAPTPPDGPRDAEQTAAGRSVTEAVTFRALVECAGCGTPGRAPGEDLCPACLNWPLCTTCTGPTPRRAHPTGNGACASCNTAAAAS
ncbi:hypothetical protein P8605_02620 [Streptomyces sp. T-3]|nr:hypothetical protein [Streptomyces sp. T-3]